MNHLVTMKRDTSMNKLIMGFLLGLLIAIVIESSIHPPDMWIAPKGANGTIEEAIPIKQGPLAGITANYHVFDVKDGKVSFIYSDDAMVVNDNDEEPAYRTSLIFGREARAYDDLVEKKSFLCADRAAGIREYLQREISIWGTDSAVLHRVGIVENGKWRNLRVSDLE
jgi:hypothetical protein